MSIRSSRTGPFRVPGFWIVWTLNGLAGAGLGTIATIPTYALTDIEFTDVTIRYFSAITLSGSLGLLVGTVLCLMVADRFPKKRAIKWCYVAMAASSAAAFIIALTGQAELMVLLVSYAVIGMFHGLSLPLIWGLVAELVPRIQLSKAIVMLSWSGLIAALLGVLLVPLLFSEFFLNAPYELALLYAAVLFLVTGALTGRLPRHAGSTRFHGGGRDALKLLFHARRLRALWLYGIVTGVCLAVFSSSIGILAFEDLEGSLDYGWLMMAQGGGGILATVALAFVISGKRGWPVVIACGGLAALLFVAIASVDTFWPLLTLMIPFGAAGTAATLGTDAIAMRHTRFGYFGRIAALLFLGGSASSAGVWILSYVFGDWGQGEDLVVAAGVVLLIASLLLFRTWRATRDEPSPFDGLARTPSTTLIVDSAAPQKPAAPD